MRKRCGADNMVKSVKKEKHIAFGLKTLHILRPLPFGSSAELLSIDIGFAMGTEWQQEVLWNKRGIPFGGHALRRRAIRWSQRHQLPICLAREVVHFEAVDGPVGLIESSRVVGHKVVACRRCRRTRCLTPYGAGPVSAEGGVEDDSVLPEVRWDAAALRSVQLCQRCSPLARYWMAALDV